MTDLPTRLRTYPNGTDLDREAADKIEQLHSVLESALNYQMADALRGQIIAALKE